MWLITAVILLTGATMCGLLWVNLSGRKTTVPQVRTAAAATEESPRRPSSSTHTNQSASSYKVRDSEARNETGNVSNEGTNSKLMEDLMLHIAKDTAIKE